MAVEIVDDEATVVPDEPVDLFGHGTACAGIIVGLAPEVEIYSVRVLGADLRGKGAAFLAGPRVGRRAGRPGDEPEPVVQERARCSRSSTRSSTRPTSSTSRWSAPSTTCPACATRRRSHRSSRSPPTPSPDPETFFYNPTPPVEWGAWGVDVPIGWKDGGTTVATGNSFAAPHMAGLVARILSKHPGLTPFEVKAVLAAIANNPQPKF